MDKNCVNWKGNVEFKFILHAYSTELPIISYAISKKMKRTPCCPTPQNGNTYKKHLFRLQNCVSRAGKGAKNWVKLACTKLLQTIG